VTLLLLEGAIYAKVNKKGKTRVIPASDEYAQVKKKSKKDIPPPASGKDQHLFMDMKGNLLNFMNRSYIGHI
jgi:hypothetical protein